MLLAAENSAPAAVPTGTVSRDILTGKSWFRGAFRVLLRARFEVADPAAVTVSLNMRGTRIAGREC
jgi:hypothetical protein